MTAFLLITSHNNSIKHMCLNQIHIVRKITNSDRELTKKIEICIQNSLKSQSLEICYFYFCEVFKLKSIWVVSYWAWQ
jgi:hypothetical protein